MPYYLDRVGGPAYGPRPWLALDDESAEELLTQHLSTIQTDKRKKRARDRWRVYTENYRRLIKDRIDTTHFDEEVVERIFRHIDLANNLALDITNAVCNVWKHSHASNVRVEGASKRQNEALRQLLEESGFHRHAKSWNREAWLLGPVTAIPVIRNGRLSFDTLLPHFYDTADNSADPWGSPLAATWDISDHECATKHDEKVTSILLDGQAWRYYEHQQGVGTGARPKLIEVVPHGVGEFPGATLSFDIAHGNSRWDCDRHQRLIDATIKIGCLEAVLDFVRKSQNKYLLVLLGNLTGVPTGQTLDSERPITANTGSAGSPNQVSISVENFDLDPESHIKHQAWLMQTIARSYGGQVASRPGSSSILESEVSFSHEALTEQRNEQIPFARDFMRELLAKAVATCKAQGHRLAAWLPSPESVREGLIVKFPPLSRSFANVDEQLKYEADALSRGKYSFADLVRPMLPGASDDELERFIKENLEKQAPLIALMTTRDQSLAPAPANETESQRNGRQGPEVRDSNNED